MLDYTVYTCTFVLLKDEELNHIKYMKHTGVSIHWTGLLGWHIFGIHTFLGHIFGFTHSKFFIEP